jgi:hypothetical protein
LSGFVLYAALLLAQLYEIPTDNLRAAMAMFLIGAGVGLFGRLTAQADVAAVSDDYGLATARLIAAPQLSGTAAIIGLAIVAAAAPSDTGTIDLANAFDVFKVPNLLLAAGFALTPSLVLDRIRQEHNKLAEQVQSMQPTEGKAASNAG